MKMLMYANKTLPYLVKNEHEEFWYIMNQHDYNVFKDVETYNGKIVAEFDFEVEEIGLGYGGKHAMFDENGYFDDYYNYMTETLDEDILLKRSCLNVEEIEKYLGNKNGYAIHIKNLHIFDEPKELNNFTKDNTDPIDYAPSKMIHVWYYDEILKKWERSIYVPVSSQESCRILNKEQTVLVRRSVLKEML